MAFKECITPEELEVLPYAAFGGKITVVDTLGPTFDAAIRYLKRQRVIGFDTETKPVFTPHQPRPETALLQLAGKERAFLFRTISLGMPRKLVMLLTSKQIIKVGAAVRDDVLGLKRLTGFEGQSFVDLQQMVESYGIKDKSVKKMSGIILGVRISKAQQLSNWEAEELNEAQQLYAATDAWICREMYMKLVHNLSFANAKQQY